MQKISVLLSVLTLACSSPKSVWQPNELLQINDCPKQVRCTLELLRDKSMIVTSNDSGLTYTLTDQPGTNVIIYKYDKIVKGNIQDAGYREEIVFEYDGKHGVAHTDVQLQQTKMLFGRFCYCKGQTGYYKVNQGTFKVDDASIATLDFSISEVPQIVTRIQFAIK